MNYTVLHQELETSTVSEIFRMKSGPANCQSHHPTRAPNRPIVLDPLD